MARPQTNALQWVSVSLILERSGSMRFIKICFCQVFRAKEEAREEVLELRLKLKEVEASVEIRKEGLEESEEDWRRRLGEQLDVVEQLQQANTILHF